jgi:2-(1,2-epoxy-1,2-dihydrophenyl)acetyl-CoA isomerase
MSNTWYGEYSGFIVERHEPGIALIRFSRPKKMNAMNMAVKRDLIEAMIQAQYDDSTRVVVFAGCERAFSAGDEWGSAWADEHWKSARSRQVRREKHDAMSTYSSLRTISQNLNRTLRNCDKLTIAAIDGYAIQSGLSLALACDFRFATARSKLGSATLRFAVLPDEGGHFLLVELLGVAKTKDFIFRKRIVSGTEALQMGLVSEIVAPQELLSRALEFAKELSDGPQTAMRLMKHAIENAAHLSFEQAGIDIALRAAITDHHPDSREGLKAFKEKRPANFKDP